MNPATARAIAQLAQSRTSRRVAGLLVAGNAFLVLLLMAIPVVLIVVILAAVDASVQATQPVEGCDLVRVGETPVVGDLDDEQVSNAAAIVNVARKNGINEYGQVIAIAAALQESTLRNYRGGHADSLGLFQQRPSQGWGTARQIGDPVKSAEAFFGVARHTDNTGLMDIRGWRKLSLTAVAQQVQRSAFPYAYADEEPLARQVVATLRSDDTSSALCGNPGAMSCPSTGFSVEAGLTPDGLRVLRCLGDKFSQIAGFSGTGERAANPDSDHETGRAVDAVIPNWDTRAGNAEGWRIAGWVKRHASRLGVTYVIFDGKIWSRQRADEGWREYEHPSGSTDPTSRHLDHVHVSVAGNAAGTGAGGPGRVRLPLSGGYALTAAFGECSGLWSECHTGLDFAAPSGAPVTAVADGTVVSTTWNSAYGNLTQVRGDAADAEYWYAHQESQYVEVGDRVRAGQTIGTVGSTGNSTGPHLHLEVRVRGRPVDPETWLADHGVDP
ncbi:MAG: peptidoglycan DD-metalloendopeptidase family protein [Propionibacteriales bacterium]|nr:peptidoglycan DD-metalloendopeptidase family protein [Propionibacteriales bacterium]